MEMDNVGVSLAQLQDADFSHWTMTFADYLHCILISCHLLCAESGEETRDYEERGSVSDDNQPDSGETAFP